MSPRDLEQRIRQLLGQSLPEVDLRRQLEELAAAEISFSGFTWLWGPELYRRHRLMFRPFILSRFSSALFLPKWKWERVPWKGARAAILDAWLKQVDADDDAELFRRLYEWKLTTRFPRRGSGYEAAVRGELLSRLRAAATAARRQVVLRKLDLWFELDETTACDLYGVDARGTHGYLLRRLPRRWLGDTAKRKLWTRLIQFADQRGDAEFRWRLYRNQVPLADWQRDCLALCERIQDSPELVDELEKRHPQGGWFNLADGFYQIVQRRGRDVFPYVMRHLQEVWGGWLARGKYGKLADYAREKGWWDLWAALVRTCSAQKEFQTEVQRLINDRATPEGDIVRRLLALAGGSREWNWPGLGVTVVRSLDDAVALSLYERFPELIHGPFKLHVQPNAWSKAPFRLLHRFLESSDEEMIDFMASRLVTRSRWGSSPQLLEEGAVLANYYEALKANETVFSRRAANVLTQIPAYAIWPWAYHALIRENRLARLLFERSAISYLADERSLADLVEASEIHVMALAYRALGLDDERARAQAVRHLPLLLGTLLRPLQRGTRELAFGALDNAARTPEHARWIHDTARDALYLPDKHYPKEKLLTLIARLVHRFPELRQAAEQPRIYRRVA